MKEKGKTDVLITKYITKTQLRQQYIHVYKQVKLIREPEMKAFRRT